MSEHGRLLKYCCLWLDTLFNVEVVAERGLDKCPRDRADGKTEVPLAAVKGHWGTKNARGPAGCLQWQHGGCKVYSDWNANGRLPSPVSGAHAVPWVLKPAKWPTVQPLQSKEVQGPAPPLPSSRCKTLIPSYLCHLAQNKQTKNSEGGDLWKSNHFPKEIKYRDYLNEESWTLNCKEAI